MKTPKAALVFSPDDRAVHVQRGDVLVDRKEYREHTYHLGIVNTCGITLTRMRVVLDKVEPHLDHFVYLGKPFMIRGEKNEAGYFDLPVTGNKTPSRYAAIFHELIPKDGGRAGYVLPYVDKQKLTTDDGPRAITYRLEGGDMSRSIYFTIKIAYDDVTNRYVVTVVS